MLRQRLQKQSILEVYVAHAGNVVVNEHLPTERGVAVSAAVNIYVYGAGLLAARPEEKKDFIPVVFWLVLVFNPFTTITMIQHKFQAV